MGKLLSAEAGGASRSNAAGGAVTVARLDGILCDDTKGSGVDFAAVSMLGTSRGCRGGEIDSRPRTSDFSSGNPQPAARSPQLEERLAGAFLATAARRPNHPAVVTAGGLHSYQSVAAAALTVAGYLRNERRLSAGGRVLLLLNNSAEYLAAFYGTLLAGGVAVPLPPGVEASRLARVVDWCEPEAVLTTADVAARRGEAEFASAEKVNDAKGSGVDFVAATSYGGAMPAGGDEIHSRPPAAASLAMILFTSGSSGEPKGVMLSDANLLANARSILAYLPITPDDRALALLPFYHAFGNSVLQTHVLRGATLVIDGSAAFPSTVTEALRRHRVTSLSAVPEIYHGLLAHSDLGQSPLPALRYMTVAGGALAPPLVREVARRVAPTEFYVMYGQTEATARLAYLPPEDVLDHPDSIGQAIPGVTLRIAGEDGAAVPIGAVGELQARGPNIMLGYWRDPAGTAAVFQDGWLRTGDLAAADKHGLIYIKGRGNDLVKVQGIRLHPSEIEEVVALRWPGCRAVVVPYQHPGCSAAAGVLTRLAAFVVPDAEGNPRVEELRRHCLRELPRPKVPAHIEILPELPLNPSLKLDRAALSGRAEAACAAAITAGGET